MSGAYCRLFNRESHRESGVLSIVALQSPVESSISSGALGAHTHLLRLWVVACKGYFQNPTGHTNPRLQDRLTCED